MFEKYNGAIGNVVKAIGLLSAIIAAITGLQHDFTPGEPKFWMAVSILIIAAVYEIIARYRKKASIITITPPSLDANQIRGVQCFEEGQKLPGRDREIKLFQTIAQRRDFRFGYVSGEPGSGKTSFLRAGVMSAMKQRDWKVTYLADLSELNIRAEAINDPTLRLINYSGLWTDMENTEKLLIIDQFEECLISYPNFNFKQKFAEELVELIEQHHFKIILGLRKDFVEDLRGLSPVIKNPKSDENSIYIQNWETEEATLIFQQMCLSDGCKFSMALIESIIRDLGENGTVKPIELQIVCDHCIKQRIYDLTAYKAVGKAQGILKNFISNLIDNSRTYHAELEKIVGKYILRTLCSDLYNTKRSDGGLSAEELFREIKAPLTGRPVFNQAHFESLYPVLINKFLETKLITVTPVHKYNLSHDYLVKSIKAITADVQTLDEQLLAMLRQNIAKTHNGIPAHLSPQQYFLVRKRLTPNDYQDFTIRKYLKIETARLLKLAVVTVIGCLAVLYSFFPAHTVFRTQEIGDRSYSINLVRGSEQWYERGDTLFYTYINYAPDSTGHDTLISDGYTTKKRYEIPHRTKKALPAGLFWAKRDLLYQITKSPAVLRVFRIGDPLSKPINQINLPEWADLAGALSAANHISPRNKDLLSDPEQQTLLYRDRNGFVIYTKDLQRKLKEVKFPAKPVGLKGPPFAYFFQLYDSRVIGAMAQGEFLCLYHLDRQNNIRPVSAAVLKLYNRHQLFFRNADYRLLYYADENKQQLKAYDQLFATELSDLQNPVFAKPIDMDKAKETFTGYYSPIGLENTGIERGIFYRRLPNRLLAFDDINPETGRARIMVVDQTNHKTINIENNWLNSSNNESNLWNNKNFYWISRTGERAYSLSCLKVFDAKSGLITDSSHIAVHTGIVARNGDFHVVYSDSLQRMFIGVIKPGPKIQITETTELGDLQFDRAEAVWSEDGEMVIFKSNSKLMVAKIGQTAKLVFTFSSITFAFHSEGKDLLLTTGSGDYQINRYINVFGLDLWQLSWPKMSKRMYGDSY